VAVLELPGAERQEADHQRVAGVVADDEGGTGPQGLQPPLLVLLRLPALALELGQLRLLLLEHVVEEVHHHRWIQQPIHPVVGPQLQQLPELVRRLGVLPLVKVSHPQHPVGAGHLPLGLQPGVGVEQRPQDLDCPGVFPPVEGRPPPGELLAGVDRLGPGGGTGRVGRGGGEHEQQGQGQEGHGQSPSLTVSSSFWPARIV
jgi:hypothetical protein